MFSWAAEKRFEEPHFPHVLWMPKLWNCRIYFSKVKKGFLGGNESGKILISIPNGTCLFSEEHQDCLAQLKVRLPCHKPNPNVCVLVAAWQLRLLAALARGVQLLLAAEAGEAAKMLMFTLSSLKGWLQPPTKLLCHLGLRWTTGGAEKSGRKGCKKDVCVETASTGCCGTRLAVTCWGAWRWTGFQRRVGGRAPWSSCPRRGHAHVSG